MSKNTILQRAMDARMKAVHKAVEIAERGTRGENVDAEYEAIKAEVDRLTAIVEDEKRRDAEEAEFEAAARAAGMPIRTPEPRDASTRAKSTATMAESWAKHGADTLDRLWQPTDGMRAVTSGSIELPSLVEVDVVPIARPTRLLDLVVNRQNLDSHEFEYIRQTVRTNNAAPVADNALKPTSVFTVTPITDTAKVVAHLSEPIPIRLLADHDSLRRWLSSEMGEGVLDGLEGQVLSGDGLGENLTGLLSVAGATSVSYATDRLTTLRKARTALDTIGEVPTAWVISPADAEAVDLTREGAEGSFLVSTAPGNIFGTYPVIVSPSMPEGIAVLGDFGQLKLYVREGVRLDVDAGGALFERNQLRMRAEGRFGLGILRPAAFAVIDLTAV